MGYLQQHNQKKGIKAPSITPSSGGYLQRHKASPKKITPTKKPKKITPTPIKKTPVQKLIVSAKDVIKKVGGFSLKLIAPRKKIITPKVKKEIKEIKPLTLKPKQTKLTQEQLKMTQLLPRRVKQQLSPQLTKQTKKYIKERPKQRDIQVKANIEKVRRKEIRPGYKEPGALGQFVEALKQHTAHAFSSFGATAEMVGNATGNMAISDAGSKIRERWAKSIATNPEWSEPAEGFDWGDPEKYARLVGGIVPSIVGGIATGIVATIASGGNIVVGTGATILYAFGIEGGSVYQEAKDAGVSEKEALKWGSLVGTINGSLEAFFPAKILKSVFKPAIKPITRSLGKTILKTAKKYGVKVLENGTLEGSTEAIQELVSNATAQNYEENRKLWDGILESFVGGFIAGGFIGGFEGDVSIQPKTDIKESLEEGEKTPSEVINTVMKSGQETTAEGKELIKTAMEAKKQGKNIEVTKEVVKPVEKSKVADIEKRIDNLLEVAKKRMAKADLSNQRLKPSEIDWLYQDERALLEKLKQELPKVSQAEAIERIRLKRIEKAKPISKELEPLAKEAKKYKSAEEFGSISPTSGGKYVAYDTVRKERLYKKGSGANIQMFDTEKQAREALNKVYKEKGYSQLTDIYKQATAVKPPPPPSPIKKEVSRVEVKKPVIKPKVVKVPREQLPVGEGAEKVSRLEARVKKTLDNVSQEQIDKLGLSTYKELNKKEQIRKASEYVTKSPDEALQVLRGDKVAPKGVLRNAIYVAMQNEAVGNVELARKLASISSTRLGQEIGILTEIDPYSSVKLMKDVIKVKEETFRKRYGERTPSKVKKTITKQIKSKVKVPDKYSWSKFLDSIEC